MAEKLTSNLVRELEVEVGVDHSKCLKSLLPAKMRSLELAAPENLPYELQSISSPKLFIALA